ncbi:FadR/GntR family transcriptional regulator [Ornithinicoccus hortensis]|uniref:GntR family transcriptional regulator n=1 Tax=Ornithinicoccus hortensis TaxID=82346 RepID=A0A542YNQ8_9MICO|nr:FadR/GntR family transcriptional regulator [Ornithinicoccus hortensis]TQL49742.1 GntR family transcriptional regulator [Ornithinicoccus hortensis]
MAEPGGGPQWAPVPRNSTHELVIEAIEDQILTGQLTVDDPLPSERDLASKLQVSRAGVREAIRVLESHGVLRSNVGSGRGAGTFVASLPSAALTRLLRLHVALANFPVDDVVETRVLLERSSASLAAQRADEDSLAAIRSHLDAMDAPGLSREEFNDADTEFHVAIARAGGNRLFANLTEAIRASLRPRHLAAFHRVADWEAMAAVLRQEHHGIERAISAGEGDRAAELAERHIRGAAESLPQFTEGPARPAGSGTRP